MTKVRHMQEADADVVRRVDAAAFGVWWKQSRREVTDLPSRTQANVLSCLEKDPGGCFVAEEDGQVVGIIFSRTWGRVGWFGTFAVLPECQGRGIGQQLIAASLDYLHGSSGIIGLETMPESPYNLGLYLRLGFEARLPTFFLSRRLDRPGSDAMQTDVWSTADYRLQERWLADLRQATARIWPGLDYSKEILTTARRGLGETLVLANGARAIGFSTVWLVAAREGWGDELASLHVSALDPEYTDEESFCALVQASEALARLHAKEAMTIAVNASHSWALEHLLRWGYRVDRSMVRMVLQGTDANPIIDSHVNLSRWAG
jgi:ribosomal protein S18 acetylase RimI-like enzyme